MHYKLKYLLFIFLCFGLIGIANSKDNLINEIKIVGNQRIDKPTILAYMGINQNSSIKISRDDLNEVFKTLFSTDLFSDILFSVKGRSLIIKVKENPIINRVALEGNKRLKDDDILPEIFLKPRDIFTSNKVKQNLQIILALYRADGRYAARVEPKIIYKEQNRVDLVFEINEGPLSKIEYIKILGNDYFSDRKIKSEMMTGEARWWKVLSGGGKYDPDLLNFDKENLRRFYANQGFVDADISEASAELNRKKEEFFITLVVNEGERYKFGKISADLRIKGIDKKLIKSAITFSKGEWFSARRLDDVVVKITENIISNVTPFVEVSPKLTRDNDSIDINFIVKAAEKRFINKINISGNTRTHDKVIRRKLRVSEGDAFNTTLVKRSRTLVSNLGHFARVDIKEEESMDALNSVDLDVTVQETTTGDLSIGGGFSSANGATAQIGLSENNLLGKSQKLRANILASDRQNRIDFSFTEPFFLDRDASMTTDVYTTVTEFLESNYDNERDGAGFGIGYNIGEYGRQNIFYRLEKRNIIAYSGASASVISESGENILSLISLSNTIDKTDSRMDPSDGWYVNNTVGFAGLGGDKRHIKFTGRAAKFRKILEEKITFSLMGNFGYIIGLNQNIEISDRFVIGDNTFVGFKNAGIGPRDIKNDDALGGNFYYTATPELKFGLGLPKELGIKGRIFSTVGSLSVIDSDNTNYYDDTSIRLTAGAGVLWQSPFGPIRLDYSKALLKESYDKTETFSFNIGTLF